MSFYFAFAIFFLLILAPCEGTKRKFEEIENFSPLKLKCRKYDNLFSDVLIRFECDGENVDSIDLNGHLKTALSVSNKDCPYYQKIDQIFLRKLHSYYDLFMTKGFWGNDYRFLHLFFCSDNPHVKLGDITEYLKTNLFHPFRKDWIERGSLDGYTWQNHSFLRDDIINALSTTPELLDPLQGGILKHRLKGILDEIYSYPPSYFPAFQKAANTFFDHVLDKANIKDASLLSHWDFWTKGWDPRCPFLGEYICLDQGRKWFDFAYVRSYAIIKVRGIQAFEDLWFALPGNGFHPSNNFSNEHIQPFVVSFELSKLGTLQYREKQYGTPFQPALNDLQTSGVLIKTNLVLENTEDGLVMFLAFDEKIRESLFRDAPNLIEFKGQYKVDFRARFINLLNLKILVLKDGFIRSLILSDLPSLEVLRVVNCQMERITFQGDFPILRLLDCSLNRLETFPVLHLPSLEKLYLFKNQIKFINLNGFEKLREINIEENPLEGFILNAQKIT